MDPDDDYDLPLRLAISTRSSIVVQYTNVSENEALKYVAGVSQIHRYDFT